MCVNAVDAALRTPAPSLAAKLVMVVLAHHRNFRSGLCFVSGKTLAAETGMDVRSVRRAVLALSEETPTTKALISVIRTKREGSRSEVNRYHLAFATGENMARLDAVDAAADRIMVARIENGEMDTESEGSIPQSDMSPPRLGGYVRRKGQKSDAESPEQDSEQEESNRKDALRAENDGESSEADSDPGDSEASADVKKAVAMMWMLAGDQGRKRSTKLQTEEALRSALARRPASQTADERLQLIMKGLQAYWTSADARKEGGSYERGLHRMIQRDRWESFLDLPPSGEAAPVDPEFGTMDNPGPQRQAFWADLARQGMPWNEDRGPRPGLPGCRISDEIQRAHGFTPGPALETFESAAMAANAKRLRDADNLALASFVPEKFKADLDFLAEDDDSAAFD